MSYLKGKTKNITLDISEMICGGGRIAATPEGVMENLGWSWQRMKIHADTKTAVFYGCRNEIDPWAEKILRMENA